MIGDPSQAPHSHFYFGSLAVALKHRYKSGFIFQLLMTILAHLNTVADRWDRMLSCHVFHLHHAYCRCSHLPISEQSSTITSDAVKFVASLLLGDTCHTFKPPVTLAFTSLRIINIMISFLPEKHSLSVSELYRARMRRFCSVRFPI